MPADHASDISPGQQLQILLKQIYSPDAEAMGSFVSKVDDALIAEGDLEQLVYDSTINYVLRRLITTAEFLKRSVEKNNLPESRFIYKLRAFLTSHMHIPTDKVEYILALLILCTKVSRKTPTPKMLSRIRKSAAGRGGQMSCYICGIAVQDSRQGVYDSAEVEHLWSNAMGGSNEDFNLKISCFRCNQSKASFIDASDYHYEEMSLVSHKGDEHFSTEMRRDYEVALWAKNDFKCMRCQKPAPIVGKLDFGRRNLDDSWHFLNVGVYCREHNHE